LKAKKENFMSKAKFISFASVISEMKQSDMFMSVKMRILETPKANLNGVRVTEAFIDEVVGNEERYVGLPLYADVKSLLSGKYGNLGHMYNAKTGEFYSTQIGSFYQFEKETFKGGAYLVGYARIPKRNKKLSQAIATLFADGSLKFSFEIACSDYEEDEEGILIIDASENNYLEGTAIVTFPACEDAVALEFVAQREAGNTERGEMEMAEVEKLENKQELMAEENTEATQPEQAATQPEAVAEQETETAETKVQETAEKTVENTEETVKAEEEKTEDASCKKEEKKAEEAEKETAAVYVDTTTSVTETTYAYDSETGKSAFQRVEVTEGASDTIEGTLVETEEGLRVAEADGDPEPTANDPVPTDNSGESGDGDPEPAADETVPRVENDDEKKKTAEQLIAELTETVKALAEEVKSLKEQRVTASAEKLNVAAEAINPFVDSMTAKADYYDLLQPAEKKNGRDLLSR
jgi:hypothetical protein